MVDINQSIDQIQVFKGFFYVYVGVTPYRLTELQDLQIIAQADTEKHYSDAGVKKKVISGDSSSWRLATKLTTDLFDTAITPTDIKTISYIEYAIMTLRTLPQMQFESVNQSDSAANKFVHHIYSGYIENCTKTRNRGTGTYEVEMSGEIQGWISDQRTAS